ATKRPKSFCSICPDRLDAVSCQVNRAHTTPQELSPMKKITLPLVMIGVVLTMAVGCKSEIDNKPAAQVAEVTAQAEAAPAEAEPAKLTEVTFAVEDSKIEWVGAKVTGDHSGGFNGWSGKAQLNGDKLERVEFEVDTTTVYSDDDQLTGHLKSDDFFDVENHPRANFVSTKIAEGGADGATHTVTGNMTMRGVTKEIAFPATIKVADGKLTATSEFTINRFD